jgi:acetyl-CoA carboxylase carboxyltransferase component
MVGAVTWQPEIDELRRREELARAMGGEAKIDRQHAAGRLTVRERIDALLDPGSFEEIGMLAGRAGYDGAEISSFRPANFVTGMGRIAGRRVAVGGDDFTVRGGAADAAIMRKQVYAETLAHDHRVPMVRLVDGTGGGGSVRMIEDMGYTYCPILPGWDTVVANMGRIPVVALCLGPVAGLGAARVAAAHLSVMVRGTSQMFIAGPEVVRQGVGEDLDKEQLGGVDVQEAGGAIDVVVDSEQEAFDAARRFLSYLPSNVWEAPPATAPDDDPERRDEWLLSAVPRERRRPYDMRRILAAVLDTGSVFETGRRFGGSVITALARLDGLPVGVVAFDPLVWGGGLTAEGSDKLTRFVDLCDTFHLPLVKLVDQPGFVLGVQSERKGTIRRGVRAVAAIHQATVPSVAVVVRRVYGVGGAGLWDGQGLNLRYAWPSADWGSLPLEGGIEAAYRADLDAAEDRAALLDDITTRLDAVRSPFRTAEHFGIEAIIDPRETRPVLCRWVHDAYGVVPHLLGPAARSMRP